MEEGGMTDLQFKSYLRLLILHLEHIEQAETVEKKREEIDKLISLLQHTIESCPPPPIRGAFFVPVSVPVRRPPGSAAPAPPGGRPLSRVVPCVGVDWISSSRIPSCTCDLTSSVNN